MVYIYNDKNKKSIKCRALLDTCATANFITESMIKQLGIRSVGQRLAINTINSTGTISKGIVQIVIRSTHDNFSKELTCFTLPSITECTPSEVFQRETIKIPANVKLADPEFHVPRPVDLLIGAGATLSLFSIGQINLSRGGRDLYLQKTRFGWIVTGETSVDAKQDSLSCYFINLEKQIAKFWTIEELNTSKPKSNEEKDCEEFYRQTVSRDSDGRYIVRLPFRNSNNLLGESRSAALKRLFCLERRLNANIALKSEYTRIIDEYKALGHMTLDQDPESDGYYMPHHAVAKETSHTTKVRVVFDASAKTDNGLSLNDLLMVGPTIQEKLFSHLIRFRTYVYVISSDIEKMYRQIVLDKRDRRFQRILWREN
ncbi:uncharacterized protein [Cardiocondyla obscurior]|uniref:uncharacterized protein n=1 Tax=Cardiocondyla obscurior TaxID=286306 RepID=UPI0039656ABF